MAEEAQDEASKTEEPTQKRLDEASEKGDTGRSQEVGHWFMFMAGALVIAAFGGAMASSMVGAMLPFLERAHDFRADGGSLQQYMYGLSTDLLGALGPAVVIVLIFALAGQVVQTKPILNAEKLKPELARISPIKGFERLFSAHSLVEFGKSILKLMVVAAVGTYVLWPEAQSIVGLVTVDPAALMPTATRQVLYFLGGVIAVMTVVAGGDLVWQKFSALNKLRMTRQEVKDELRQTEGDPLVKARFRQIRLQRSRRRMMAAVPTADVVIVNPTHYAVALKYEMGKMGAPKVVAKGVDSLALKIRAIANDNKVPIVENPPLARALYTVDVDAEIPGEHYRAVAEIISYVMRLRNQSPARR